MFLPVWCFSKILISSDLSKVANHNYEVMTRKEWKGIIRNKALKFWKDPVWSKVISAGLLAVIPLLYAFIKSITSQISFTQALITIYNLKIRLVHFIGALLLYGIVKMLLRKVPSSISKKQTRLKELNHSASEERGILFKWQVSFGSDGEPFIWDLQASCCLHGNFPIRFMSGKCPHPDCRNNYEIIDFNIIKNHFESELVHRWDEIKKS